MNEQYAALLKQALAGETETVRLYLAAMAACPPEDMPTLLEINKDETDHQAKIADLLINALSGEDGEQERTVPGVS